MRGEDCVEEPVFLGRGWKGVNLPILGKRTWILDIWKGVC